MQCERCGKELYTARCAFCGYVNENYVRELSPIERDRFRGITIDSSDGRIHFHNTINRMSRGSNFRFGGILLKIALGLFLFAAVFIALPITFVLVAIAIILWMIIK